jgi:hypothetical protein
MEVAFKCVYETLRLSVFTACANAEPVLLDDIPNAEAISGGGPESEVPE